MIQSFHCRDTERLFHDETPAKFRAFARVARRRLLAIHAAVSLPVLRAIPGNRLEAMRGNRRGQYSIRVNRQWRVCFRWQDGNAYDVEIVDYH